MVYQFEGWDLSEVFRGRVGFPVHSGWRDGDGGFFGGHRLGPESSA